MRCTCRAPSPQRTPVLYQAGSSARGRRFAATHAECVFVNPQDKAAVKAIVDDIRAEAVQLGRAADDVKVFMGTTLVLGRTEQEARDKFEDYRRYVSSEAALVHAAASLGIDFAKYDLDEPIDGEQEPGDRLQRRSHDAPRRTAMDAPQVAGADGARQPPGAADRLRRELAETLIGWVQDTGIDGFNLSRTVVPECIDDVIDLLVPALQERGAYKTRTETAPIAKNCSVAPGCLAPTRRRSIAAENGNRLPGKRRSRVARTFFGHLTRSRPNRMDDQGDWP